MARRQDQLSRAHISARKKSIMDLIICAENGIRKRQLLPWLMQRKKQSILPPSQETKPWNAILFDSVSM